MVAQGSRKVDSSTTARATTPTTPSKTDTKNLPKSSTNDSNDRISPSFSSSSSKFESKNRKSSGRSSNGKQQQQQQVEQYDKSNKTNMNTSEAIEPSLSISVSPSTLEVDYDTNVTELYRAITNQKWDVAIKVCQTNPTEAATWVVRHYTHDEISSTTSTKTGYTSSRPNEIMWRFLPLHSACARQPPASVIQALLQAYPDALQCRDDQGMYPLHYACGNQAPIDTIALLLQSFPGATEQCDPRGMLPLHYVACWGPSSTKPSPTSNGRSIIDMLIQANPAAIHAQDIDGNTPLPLALDGDYYGKDTVINILRHFMTTIPKRNNNPKRSTMQQHQQSKQAQNRLPPVASGSSTVSSTSSSKSKAQREVVAAESSPSLQPKSSATGTSRHSTNNSRSTKSQSRGDDDEKDDEEEEYEDESMDTGVQSNEVTNSILTDSRHHRSGSFNGNQSIATSAYTHPDASGSAAENTMLEDCDNHSGTYVTKSSNGGFGAASTTSSTRGSAMKPGGPHLATSESLAKSTQSNSSSTRSGANTTHRSDGSRSKSQSGQSHDDTMDQDEALLLSSAAAIANRSNVRSVGGSHNSTANCTPRSVNSNTQVKTKDHVKGYRQPYVQQNQEQYSQQSRGSTPNEQRNHSPNQQERSDSSCGTSQILNPYNNDYDDDEYNDRSEDSDSRSSSDRNKKQTIPLNSNAVASVSRSLHSRNGSRVDGVESIERYYSRSPPSSPKSNMGVAGSFSNIGQPSLQAKSSPVSTNGRSIFQIHETCSDSNPVRDLSTSGAAAVMVAATTAKYLYDCTMSSEDAFSVVQSAVDDTRTTNARGQSNQHDNTNNVGAPSSGSFRQSSYQRLEQSPRRSQISSPPQSPTLQSFSNFTSRHDNRQNASGVSYRSIQQQHHRSASGSDHRNMSLSPSRILLDVPEISRSAQVSVTSSNDGYPHDDDQNVSSSVSTMTMNTLQQQRLRAGTSNQENRNVLESEPDDDIPYYNRNDSVASGNNGTQSLAYKNSRPSANIKTNEPNENNNLREKGNSFTNNRGQGIVDVTHIASPGKVERLTAEIDRLRREMNESESMFEQKSIATERSWKAEIDILRRKLRRKDEELIETKSELSEICRSRESTSDEVQRLRDQLANMEVELDTTKKALEESKTECKGLRVSLGDILEQHEMMKKRSVNMNDRLGSLKVSLTGMLDQQNILASKVKERSVKVKENVQKRQLKLKELLEMEEIMEQEEDKIEASLRKQSREIEAAAAVVAAARDEE